MHELLFFLVFNIKAHSQQTAWHAAPLKHFVALGVRTKQME